MKLKINSRTLSKFDFTESEIIEINAAYDYYTRNKFSTSGLVTCIARLKSYGVSLVRLLDRALKIRELGRDSSSKKSFYYRYGLKHGKRLFKEKTMKSRFRTKEELREMYGDEYASTAYLGCGASLENFITRHGESEGQRRWDAYLKKRAETYRKKRENGHNYPKYDLDYYIGLYGETEGTLVYRNKIERQRYMVSKQRYIDEYGPDKGPELCRASKDHLSINYFIKKYGVDEGTRLYNAERLKRTGSVLDKLKRKYPDDYMERYQKLLENAFVPNLKGYQRRYGVELGLQKFQERAPRRYTRRSKSKIACEMFDFIKVEVEDLEYYNDNEMVITTTFDEFQETGKASIKPDCVYNNRIIEFYGDSFHANPDLFSIHDRPHPYRRDLTAYDIWYDDAIRILLLESRGFCVKIVWGRDYVANKLSTVEECVKWLKS